MIPGKLPPRTHIIPPVQGRYSTSPLSVKHENGRWGCCFAISPEAEVEMWFFFRDVLCVESAGQDFQISDQQQEEETGL